MELAQLRQLRGNAFGMNQIIGAITKIRLNARNTTQEFLTNIK